jgi:hypothetical protein
MKRLLIWFIIGFLCFPLKAQLVLQWLINNTVSVRYKKVPLTIGQLGQFFGTPQEITVSGFRFCITTPP